MKRFRLDGVTSEAENCRSIEQPRDQLTQRVDVLLTTHHGRAVPIERDDFEGTPEQW